MYMFASISKLKEREYFIHRFTLQIAIRARFRQSQKQDHGPPYGFPLRLTLTQTLTNIKPSSAAAPGGKQQ